MLNKRVIPCLDVRAGRVVKGVQFANLRDAGEPSELAAMYEAQGADEIVMLDVSATLEDRLAAIESVRRIRRALSIPLTVGGGVRTLADAGNLLDAGADRVSVNSAAVHNPAMIDELASRFGTQCIVVAIDAARVPAMGENDAGAEPRRSSGSAGVPVPLTWRVSVRSGSTPVPLEAGAWASQCAARGAGEILLTSIDRDGTGIGYDLELLSHVSSRVSIPVIASGGARVPADLVAALDAGAEAVLVASMLHDRKFTVREIKQTLQDAGRPIREVLT
ncbi:MAG: imidazole glycerol phosphate synthase subunit HisF [Phycisphaerales bacterium]|jgi:imidazoleglycerol phosphate synthase cyclase subunit